MNYLLPNFDCCTFPSFPSFPSFAMKADVDDRKWRMMLKLLFEFLVKKRIILQILVCICFEKFLMHLCLKLKEDIGILRFLR